MKKYFLFKHIFKICGLKDTFYILFKKRNRTHSSANPKNYSSKDEDLIADSKSALLVKSTLVTSGTLYLVLALIIVGLVWAYFGEIDQSTSAEGRVIPATEDKIIQSLDGGIISNIFVIEGQIIKKGQVLVEFDNSRFASDYNTDYENYLALAAKIARLTAESVGSDHIDFPAEVRLKRPDLVTVETKLFDSRRESLKVEEANLQEELATVTKEVELYKPLLHSGVVSEVEYLNVVRNANNIKEQMLEKKDKFNELVWTDLNQSKSMHASLQEKLKSLRDKLERTKLYSPVYGMVKKVYIKTIGGVVHPGMDIMEIVPLSDSLLIQARVRPSDIAFISPGQKASVKLTAYDYTIYGSLSGKVEFISPDVIEEPKATNGAAQPIYYLVDIRTNKSYFTKDGRKYYIIPGMSAMVQITTGKKTIMTYFLKPLIKAKEEALTER